MTDRQIVKQWKYIDISRVECKVVDAIKNLEELLKEYGPTVHIEFESSEHGGIEANIGYDGEESHAQYTWRIESEQRKAVYDAGEEDRERARYEQLKKRFKK